LLCKSVIFGAVVEKGREQTISPPSLYRVCGCYAGGPSNIDSDEEVVNIPWTSDEDSIYKM
jgi:hypothetical protein